MTVNLKPEQESLVSRAIEAGLIDTADEVFEIGMELVRQRLEAEEPVVRKLRSEAWSLEFHRWIHGHPGTTPLLSDEAIGRESIYRFRGK